MKKNIFIILVSALIILFSSDIFAETSLVSIENNGFGIFPDLTDYTLHEETAAAADFTDFRINKAIWPFSDKKSKGSSQVKLKSTRKAFFLSLLFLCPFYSCRRRHHFPPSPSFSLPPSPFSTLQL